MSGAPVRVLRPVAMTTPLESVVGHGVLSRFHAGCRYAWCVSRACEGCCGCTDCTAARTADPYVTSRQ